MYSAREIIIQPLSTEKSSRLKELRQYTFKVLRDANKVDIKRAVEEIFGVKVEKVRVINMRGKPRRMGIYAGRTSNWKKAIVTLKEGERIEELEV
ncbi:MAG: 50S ribosomal protein L23 [candidate division WOR-3 bacterium]